MVDAYCKIKLNDLVLRTSVYLRQKVWLIIELRFHNRKILVAETKNNYHKKVLNSRVALRQILGKSHIDQKKPFKMIEIRRKSLNAIESQVHFLTEIMLWF